MSTEAAPLERPRSPGELFVAFTLLALQGFGGVLAVAQRALCEQRRWLTREQFVEILGSVDLWIAFAAGRIGAQD